MAMRFLLLILLLTVAIIVGIFALADKQGLQVSSKDGATTTDPDDSAVRQIRRSDQDTKYELAAIPAGQPWRALGNSIAVDSKEHVFVEAGDGIYRIAGTTAELVVPGDGFSVVGVDPDDNLVLFQSSHGCGCFLMLNQTGRFTYLGLEGFQEPPPGRARPWMTSGPPRNAAVTGRSQILIIDGIAGFLQLSRNGTRALVRDPEPGIRAGDLAADFEGNYFALSYDALLIGKVETGDVRLTVPRKLFPSPHTSFSYIRTRSSGGAILNTGQMVCRVNRKGKFDCLPDSMSWGARLETLEGHGEILLRGPVVEGPSGSFYFTGDRKVYRASPQTLE
jgi:hypothetical protein